MNEKVKLSASRIKTLELCSQKYYLEKIVRLPETVHPRTIVGTVCHEFLEWLNSAKDLKENWEKLEKCNYDISKLKYALDHLNSIIEKYNVRNDLRSDIIPMINVAILYFKEAFKDAEIIFNPEVEFEIEGDKFVVLGFIDMLIKKNGRYLICDMKSMKSKFDKKEIEYNIQAIIYQWAIKQIYGTESDVEFIMMRFSPKTRYPQNHIQRVPYIGEDAFRGLKAYLEYLGEYLEDFDEKKSRNNFAIRDITKAWFCNKNKGEFKVDGSPAFYCPYKYPFDYFAKYKENKLIKTAFTLEELNPIEEGEEVRKEVHSGCPAFKNKI